MLKFLKRSLAAQIIVTAIVVLGPSVYLVASAAPAAVDAHPAATKSETSLQRAQVKIRPAKVTLATRAKEWLHRSVGRSAPRQVDPAS